MRTLTAGKARDNFSEVIARAAYGKERIYITKNGKNLALLIPVEDMALLEELADRLDAAAPTADDHGTSVRFGHPPEDFRGAVAREGFA